MSAPYISTATVGLAHASDILGVCISDKFTITCSSDGYLKFWKNESLERNLHSEILVDKVGLHHVEILQDVVDANKILLISTVSFSGKIYIFKYDYNNDLIINLNFNPLNCGLKKKTAFWAPIFDFTTGLTIFACTTVSGRTIIFNIKIENNEILFEFKGELFSNDESFATCICSNIENNKILIGHQNGNAYLYDFNKLILLYNFESFGLKENSKSLNIIRSVSFSPNNGELLAIANDSGPFGTISLYDVKYGEYLGSFIISTHSSNVGIGNFGHSKWCLSISFNKQGNKLVSCGLDNLIRIWDVESRTCINSIKLNSTDLNDEDVEKLNDLDTAACTSIKFVNQGIFKEDGQNDGLVVVGFDRSIRWFREAGGI
jgi:superkiller protein 8